MKIPVHQIKHSFHILIRHSFSLTDYHYVLLPITQEMNEHTPKILLTNSADCYENAIDSQNHLVYPRRINCHNFLNL